MGIVAGRRAGPTSGGDVAAATVRAAAAPAGYLPALDGLRAVSVGLVVVAHAGLDHIVPGGLGVTIFFVISGFLITGLMIDEIAATGRLGFRNFYLRRVFRLAPALLVYIALMTPVTTLLGANTTMQDVVASILYMANYWRLYVGFPDYTPFPILWSLSIEEHYYIFFPMIVSLFIPDLRRLMLPIAVACLAALAWRCCLQQVCESGGNPPWSLCGLAQQPDWSDGIRIYAGTDTRFDSILAGAFLALAAADGCQRWRRILVGYPALSLSLVLLLLSLLIRDVGFRNTLRYSIQNVAICLLIAGVVFHEGNIISKILALRPMVYIGRLSYSLYLYHYAVVVVILRLHGPFTWRDPEFYLYFLASFALSMASYHGIETPMVKFRRRFGSRAPR